MPSSFARKLARLLLVAGVIAGGYCTSAQAQVDDLGRSRYNTAAFYDYSEPDDVTMQVRVWGAVRNPGIYRVARGTHLLDVFSAAGGPSVGTRQASDDLTIRVKLTRATEGGARQVVYQATMENEILVDDENPVMQDGDVLTVESFIERGFSVRDILGLGSSIASLVLTAISLATR